ncbi:hypothetical protein BMS3Bbin01_00014 [bacterium BMS3Bbin01]|nr:hypothetical protein BMS3Bbin01_00014 [bacterium BMS3Bbin01]
MRIWRVHTGVVVFVLTLTACTAATGAAPVADPAATVPSSTTTSPPSPTTTATMSTVPSAPMPPLLPDDYAAVAFGAWRSGDLERLARLTTGPAYRLLVDRPPSDTDRWAFTSCREVLGNTYCAWTGTSDVLSLRVDNNAADEGLPAVIEARMSPAG